MNHIQKCFFYKKMMESTQDLSDLRIVFDGPTYVTIHWTFMYDRKKYHITAYKVSCNNYDSYTVNVFRNGKRVTFFAGDGKAQKLIDHVIDIINTRKVSFNKYDSRTMTIFRTNKRVAPVAGQGKARNLIDHVIDIMGVKSR